MDAVEFIKEKNRMTSKCYNSCESCPLSGENNSHDINCLYFQRDFPAEYVAIVEKWSVENSEKTAKPPIGIIPRYLHDEERLHHIVDGINRYAEAHKDIPAEWVGELLELLLHVGKNKL